MAKQSTYAEFSDEKLQWTLDEAAKFAEDAQKRFDEVRKEAERRNLIEMLKALSGKAFIKTNASELMAVLFYPVSDYSSVKDVDCMIIDDSGITCAMALKWLNSMRPCLDSKGHLMQKTVFEQFSELFVEISFDEFKKYYDETSSALDKAISLVEGIMSKKK